MLGFLCCTVGASEGTGTGWGCERSILSVLWCVCYDVLDQVRDAEGCEGLPLYTSYGHGTCDQDLVTTDERYVARARDLHVQLTL